MNKMVYVNQEHPIYTALRKRQMSLEDLSIELDMSIYSLNSYCCYRRQMGLFPGLKLAVWAQGDLNLLGCLNDVDKEEEIKDLKKLYLGDPNARVELL